MVFCAVTMVSPMLSASPWLAGRPVNAKWRHSPFGIKSSCRQLLENNE